MLEGKEKEEVILTEICCAEPKISKSFCVIFSKPPMVVITRNDMMSKDVSKCTDSRPVGYMYEEIISPGMNLGWAVDPAIAPMAPFL
jgi:hypothetical protein